MTNTIKPKPSQTPWLLNNDVLENNKKRLALLTPYSRVMSESDSKQFEVNAAYIVKAVNNHEALRDALETLMLYAYNCESHPEYLKLLKASE